MTLTVSICDSCGGAFAAAMMDTCYACGIATEVTAAVAAHAMKEAPPDTDAGAPPVLTVGDFTALERLLRLWLQPDDPIAAALTEKLDRSWIVASDAIASDVATLGSRVIFSAADGPPEARVLVLPVRHSAAGWTLPVTTPRGLALLGHSPGAVVRAACCGDGAEVLHLIEVVRGPEPAIAVTQTLRSGRGLGLPGGDSAPLSTDRQ